MTGLRPKQLGRIGMFYMEEAVLDALMEAQQDQAFGSTEVMRRTGIVSGVAGVPDAMVADVLTTLVTGGRVERTHWGHYVLSATEVASRTEEHGNA